MFIIIIYTHHHFFFLIHSLYWSMYEDYTVGQQIILISLENVTQLKKILMMMMMMVFYQWQLSAICIQQTIFLFCIYRCGSKHHISFSSFVEYLHKTHYLFQSHSHYTFYTFPKKHSFYLKRIESLHYTENSLKCFLYTSILCIYFCMYISL